jgi:succinate dehydrogenase/fumarate reductase iron-sulfur protein
MQKGKVVIFRYNPETDKQPYYETHEYPFEPGMSALDVATYVYENIDASFSFGYGCRNSHCGICGAKISGKPGLMCRESATAEMTLEPLDNLPLIRDIMVDWKACEEWHYGLRLFLERLTAPAREPESIEREDLERFKIVSRCVACHSCTSVCPAFQENRHAFWGPAAFVQLARHAFDPRDDLNREIMAHSAGIYHCTLCGECKKVCPHGISPKKSIELLLTRIEARKKG